MRVALSWYVSLERGCIKAWRDLAEAFLKQYNYNEDMAHVQEKSRKVLRSMHNDGASWWNRSNHQ
ncbi:hypothetical protein CR513_25624, partial [Mucuna pruriens]